MFQTLNSGRLYIAEYANEDRETSDVTLIIPPFGDEMNKSRATLARFARRLSKPVVMPDLFGTGDSEGDFTEASVSRWLQNLNDLDSLLTERGQRISAVVGLRFGCLLLSSWAQQRSDRLDSVVLCQPVTSGQQYLRQLFRLAAMSKLASSDSGKFDAKAVFESGHAVNCGGYLVDAQLAEEVEALQLAPVVADRISLLEVKSASSGTESAPQLSPGLRRVAENWDVQKTVVIPGAPFWQSTEIVVNDQLIDEICQCL